MYSDAEAHLANLDHCGSRDLRRAYLTILVAASTAGYDVSARTVGDVHELRIRDHAGRQFFAVDIGDAMRFGIRTPAMAMHPFLAGEAMVRFGEWVTASGDEVTVPVRDVEDAERIAEWLFGAGAAMRTELNPEYAERISA